MKTNILLNAKAAILTAFLLVGVISASTASSFVASFSGNWSNASNWSGNQPGFSISNADNVVIPAGVTIILDADLTVNGSLNLNGGSLNLNAHNLTINGGIACTGLGSVIGNKLSNITCSGFGGEGNMVFSADNQSINNLTVNIGSNSGIFIGSDLNINGTLALINGYLGIGNNNLSISEKGSIQGGSSTNYIVTNGTGSLTVAVPATGSPYLFQVGTQNNYAPVAITNNSATTATFTISAQSGVLTGGATGSDMCDAEKMINTGWNISSSNTQANVTLEMFWNTNMQVNGFNNTEAYVSQYNASGWGTQLSTSATLNTNGMFSLKMEGVTALSQFAVFGQKSTTGISNVAANTSFGLYPNPANQSINVSVTQTSNLPLLKIYDVTGNEVISQQVENSVTAVNIANLSNGVYFASLNGAPAQKFIKE